MSRKDFDREHIALGHHTTTSPNGRRRHCHTCATTPTDPIAITRTITGDRPAWLAPGDRHTAILTLAARGLTATEIARLVGCSARTVGRHTSTARQTAA